MAIVIKRKSIPLTIEKLCKWGEPVATYDFGEVESGKNDWVFYCNSCNPHAINCSSSKCSFRAIHYTNSSGKYIVDGERLKPTYAEIEAYSKKREEE